MKKLIAINFLHPFLEGAMVVVLPLLLLERKIEIYKIGIIFSILPLVFMIVRLFFAAISDQIGNKIFFLINSFSNSISKIVFFLCQISKRLCLWKGNRRSNAKLILGSNSD